MRILIIEDDQSMAQLLAKLMGPIRESFPGSEIQIVHNFEDARRVIQAIPPPDIALLDLSLPPLRREDTIARLHEIEGRCAIVIVTGHPAEEVRRLLGSRDIPVVHKSPSMIKNIFAAMHYALARFQGKDRLDAAYEEAWDRLRALKSIPSNHGA